MRGIHVFNYASINVIFFLIFFIKAYVVGTHSNCLDLLKQLK